MVNINSIRFLPADDETPHDRIMVCVPDDDPAHEIRYETPVTSREPAEIVRVTDWTVRMAQEAALIRVRNRH